MTSRTTIVYVLTVPYLVAKFFDTQSKSLKTSKYMELNFNPATQVMTIDLALDEIKRYRIWYVDDNIGEIVEVLCGNWAQANQAYGDALQETEAEIHVELFIGALKH